MYGGPTVGGARRRKREILALSGCYWRRSKNVKSMTSCRRRSTIAVVASIVWSRRGCSRRRILGGRERERRRRRKVEILTYE